MKTYAIVFLMLLMVTGCGSNDLAEIEMEGSNSAEIVRFYLGSFATPETQDPVNAGILIQNEGKWQLDVAKLELAYPNAKGKMKIEDGKISLATLKQFVYEEYYAARKFPETLNQFKQQHPFTEANWTKLVINSAMTNLERTIYVEESALRNALKQYKTNNQTLIYPMNTVIVGEHREGGKVVETTVMKKRADGLWDFWLYDETGNLAKQTLAKPKVLKNPVQCVGCHFGNKLYEPEKSYPNEIAPTPEMVRKIHEAPNTKTQQVIDFFQEHQKRSDRILGIYNSLLVAKLLEKRDKGELATEDITLLKEIGL